MGVRLPTILQHAKHILRQRSLHGNHKSSPQPAVAGATTGDVPKGHFAVYVVGESCNSNKQRFVVPISHLKHPLFQDLLRRAEEEYGFDHPMGGLTLPCSQDAFLNATWHI